MPEAEVVRRGQAMPLAELQRIQAEKRGEVPPTPTPPGVPRRIPEIKRPSPTEVKRMRDQLALLERQVVKSPYERWRLEDDRVVSKGDVLSAFQENKNLIRNYLAQREVLERNLASLSKISYEGVRYKAYVDDQGRTIITPPPGIPDLENLRNIITHSPPWVEFQTVDGRVISRAEAYDLVVRPEIEIVARVEAIKQQIRTGDPGALWNYLTWSLGLLPADFGGVIADWAFTAGGLKTAEEHIRSQVELETRTLEELKTVEGRLGLILKSGALFVAPFVAAKAVGLGMGYLAGIAPRAVPAAKFISQVTGAYIAGSEAAEISSLIQAGKHEEAASRGTELGIQVAIGIKAFGPAYRTGLIAGYRKRLSIKAKTDIERARVNTMFDAFKSIDKMPHGEKTVVRITDVENLSADDIVKLTNFLKSPQGRKFHIILGGSAANPVPGRMPHDIDMSIGKYRIPRPKFRGVAFKRWESSRVKQFQKAMMEFGFSEADVTGKTKKFDIHDAEKVGAIFEFKGKEELAAARVRRPVRVKEEPFRWKVGIIEQLERKLASMLVPGHVGRGKDWDDFIALLKAKIDSDLAAKLITAEKAKAHNTLLSKLIKFRPKIKDGKLIAPAKPPPDIEPISLTRFERFVRPYLERPVFPAKKEDIRKFLPQMIEDEYGRQPILTRILAHIIGVDNTAKLLDFLKPPEGEKLLASFGMIPERKRELFKPPFYVPPVRRKPEAIPRPTPYVTMLAPPTRPPIAPPITPAITPPVITPYKPIIPPPPITPTVAPPVKPVPPVMPIYKPRLLPRKPRKPPIEKGYHTLAKKHATKPKQRQWVQLSDRPLKEKQALGLGAKAVDESVARTFKIKKTTKPPVSKPQLDNVWYRKKHKFRKPIKAGKIQHKSPLWIEKSKHLIDSPGEFRGITVEGWKAIQRKKEAKMFMYTGPPKRKR